MCLIRQFGVLLNKNAYPLLPKSYNISFQATELLMKSIDCKKQFELFDMNTYNNKKFNNIVNDKLRNQFYVNLRTNTYLLYVYNDVKPYNFNTYLSDWNIEYIPEEYINNFNICINMENNQEYIKIIDNSFNKI
jgi:hypothetical protein